MCDGEWDCPSGYDEHNCFKYSCSSLFNCRKSQLCVQIGDTCNKFPDCPYGDDELLCDIPQCPKRCICLNYAIKCQYIHNIFPMFSEFPYIFLFLIDSSDNFVEMMFLKSLNSIFVDLLNNLIEHFCSKNCEERMELLSINLNFNRLKLDRYCFKKFPFLYNLSIASNDITVITDFSFCYLKILNNLDLSHNDFKQIYRNFLTCLHALKILNLFGNLIKNIQGNAFSHFDNIIYVNTSIFEICCSIRGLSACQQTPMWPYSCSNLLPEIFLKVIFWIVGSLSIVFTLLAFWINIAKLRNLSTADGKSKGSYNVIVSIVNLAQMLYGVYVYYI